LEAEKKALSEKAAKAKKQASHATDTLKKNSDNPVILGNAAAYIALFGFLGYGGYRKYTTGELTWKVAGLWAGVVGAFAVGDYYASQYVDLLLTL
jgi:hypothetical protein